MDRPQAIFLLGPTASGKTALALQLAERFPVEIISVDSALVYRDMDIGTAKPDASTLLRHHHHLVNLIAPTEAYSAARFCDEALAAMRDIVTRGKVPLLVGGTMLYAKALLEGLSDLPEADPAVRAEIEARAAHLGWPAMHQQLARVDPDTASRLKPADSQRIQRALEVYAITGTRLSALQTRAQRPGVFPYAALQIALAPGDRRILHERIARRFDMMIEQGLVAEVRSLRQRYALSPDLPSMRCVGYRQAWQYIDGEIDAMTLRESGIAATRQLAKRQMTWLRAMPEFETFDCLRPDLHVAIGARCAMYLQGNTLQGGTAP